MKQLFLILILFCMISCSVHKSAGIYTEPQFISTVHKNVSDATLQYKFMMKNLPPDRFPKTYYPATGKLKQVILNGGVADFTLAHCFIYIMKQRIQYYMRKLKEF